MDNLTVDTTAMYLGGMFDEQTWEAVNAANDAVEEMLRDYAMLCQQADMVEHIYWLVDKWPLGTRTKVIKIFTEAMDEDVS